MTNKENGLTKVLELVTRFNEQLPAYKKSDYNETQTRRDFIDPFFKALGWDIDNEQGFAESYREVIHEDKVKVGKATKSPDYSFRLSGGQRLFFVEAKKPSVLIKDDIQPAYQVRRYGWSAKLNVSVITDFEEFAIYDCTKKPNPTDKSSVARVKYITFNDYQNEWDFLWSTFSKEAVLKGSFDKFIGGNANKKGTTTVDKEFLISLDTWRTLLAETISKENKQLDEDELNFVVQQTLDRIVFLRICEDRSIEPYANLQNAVNSPLLGRGAGGEAYKNLLQEFKQADHKYNSGLFDFKKDKLSHTLAINNKTLKTIINQLYYPECPYEFSVLSVEILGSAYEQFLGKTITINNRGKAVIELKPEVRKAGGVYYTPQYIVDYIVTNTIGNLTKNKTPKEVAEIKIVDPACGSGSFLLGAYQYLLNWHKDYYTQNHNKKNPLTPDGNLTTTEKKKILLNNIYGVDIDTNAVEVTKLSLLLKCMEGETQASIAHQITMFKERVLPTLDDNIKSGNSLIDTDYYDNQLDFGEERKIKPFSWQRAFPDVFRNKIIEEELTAYHITCVMHNTRTSKRMIAYKVKKGTPEYLLPKEEERLLEIIINHIKENNLRVLALNLCADHLHFCIVCNPKKLSSIVGKLKSMSARAFNIWRGITIPGKFLPSGDAKSGHAHLSNSELQRGETQNSLWAQKYNTVTIETDNQLNNVLNYIVNNRFKHNLPELGETINKKITEVLTKYDDAFKLDEENGGFDVVIGNPPYIDSEEMTKTNIALRNYAITRYNSAKGNWDMYCIYTERAISLLRINGKLGFIIPNKFLSAPYGVHLKKFISNYQVVKLADYSSVNVFVSDRKINVYPIVLIVDKNEVMKDGVYSKLTVVNNEIVKNYQKNFIIDKDEIEWTSKFSNGNDIINKVIGKSIMIKAIYNIENSATVNEAYLIKEFLEDDEIENNIRLINTGTIDRYSNLWGISKTQYIKGSYHHPSIKRNILEKTLPNRLNLTYQNKIVVAGMVKCLEATIVGNNYYSAKSTSIITVKTGSVFKLEYLLGLLNCKLFSYLYIEINKHNAMAGGYMNVSKKQLDDFVFYKIDFSSKAETQSYNQIVSHVEQLLQLNKDLQTATLETKKEQIKPKIDYHEDKINTLVYQLYNLTAEEIKLVENG